MRDVVAGEVVDPAKMLFEIVDNSIVWLTIGVRSEDVAKLQTGKTKVVFEPDGSAKSIEGTIDWISTEADHKTRTVRVRVNLDNKDGKLRAQHLRTWARHPSRGRSRVPCAEFGSACRRWKPLPIRPRPALPRGGGAKGLPHAHGSRRAKDDRNTEIIAGVLPGELVATKNSAMLMAELLRGKIGEG